MARGFGARFGARGLSNDVVCKGVKMCEVMCKYSRHGWSGMTGQVGLTDGSLWCRFGYQALNPAVQHVQTCGKVFPQPV